MSGVFTAEDALLNLKEDGSDASRDEDDQRQAHCKIFADGCRAPRAPGNLFATRKTNPVLLGDQSVTRNASGHV